MLKNRMGPVYVFLGLLLLSTAASAQNFFTETSEEAIQEPLLGHARSTTIGDYNNDGWPDLFLSVFRFSVGVGEEDRFELTLLTNTGDGRFVSHSKAVPQLSDNSVPAGGGAVFGDYDNDGDLDLYVPIGAFVEAAANPLLRNDRGNFANVATEAALTDRQPTDNAIWLDYDRDGNLDILAGNLSGPTNRNKLFRNGGDGTFADITAAAGLDLLLQACCGGSNGGMSAADFNDDGWPDLYIGAYESPNRLFFNDGQGRFQEATPADVAHPGQAFGIAVGDIDNDGDLDICQAASGGGERGFLLLINQGEGQFSDGTTSAGLQALQTRITLGASLGDIDNDGDLDLLTGGSAFLFLNNGDGTFADAKAQSGFNQVNLTVSLGDYDNDGFLDALFGEGSQATGVGLYRNNGNDNHWLRVELVGTASNRSAIGARLVATAADLRQTREVLGGLGYYQDELVAHFGLGQRSQVDQLEIRWPSGQVEVLRDIPADQKIRVIEGQGQYHPVEAVVWQASLDSIAAGATLPTTITVAPTRFDDGAEITQVSADLSEWGGAENTPLSAAGNGTYSLETLLTGGPKNGLQLLPIHIEQRTAAGSYWTKLLEPVALLPPGDMSILADALHPDWQVETSSGAEALEMGATGPVHQGGQAGSLSTAPQSRARPWRVEFRPAAGIDPLGYASLRFAFHPGDTGGASFNTLIITINDQTIADLIRGEITVDLEEADWQVIEIPLALKSPIVSLSLAGNLSGTFYLDDLRLVAPYEPVTAVLEQQDSTDPAAFALDQSYPNPFNSGTVIPFALPVADHISLTIYNMLGQKVVALVEGLRQAGAYSVNWDGRDDQQRSLATGTYLYRLQTSTQVEARKLVLLR